jgi:hypothetical protein
MRHVKAAMAVGLAVFATGLGSQSAFAFGISEHEQITHDALGFTRADVIEDMDGEHAQADSGQTFENKVHFDGCTFKEGTEFINSLYHDTIDELDPANPDADPWQAADDFGYLTHPTQDFYSHSNWVETGHTDLVDAGLGFQAVPENWSQSRPDLIVAEGEMDTLPAGWSVHRDPGSLVPTVTTDTNQTFKALVSGHNDSASPIPTSDNCADPITVEHSELNKDHDSRPNFTPARNLAVAQTGHEWCRLLNLLQSEKGIGGASLAMELWSDPQHSPHPGGTPCADANPGLRQVTISLDKLTVNDDTDPGGNGELNFVLGAYTTDFKRSAQHDSAGAFDYGDDPANDANVVKPADLPAPVTLCVSPSDMIAMTVQGWDDDEPGFGGNGVYDDVLGSEDEALRGPTFSVSGDTFSPGQHTVSGGNLDATFNVSTATTDGDNDGLGDCGEKAYGTDPGKPDSDGDGLTDGTEVNTTHTDPNKADSDGDGLSDGTEVNTTHTDPNNADSDGDGLSDGTEVNVTHTDPNNGDSDGDGLNDGKEKQIGTDPNKADTDDDGLDDGLEVTSETDPLDSDSDNDGLLDGHDVEFVQHAVKALAIGDFRSPGEGNRAALLSNLDEVETILLAGNTASAVKKLENVRKHLDGCGTQADGDDWIKSCSSQLQVRDLVDLLIGNLGA